MKTYSIQQEAPFYIIGKVTRTTNAIEMQGNGAIGKLWHTFFTEELLSKIPNKIDNSLIGLYYDFESDKEGEYNYLLGTRVRSLDTIPAGMTGKEVPAETCAVFTSQKGAFPQVVIETWQKIWTLEDNKELNRGYKFEYELYDERSQNPTDAQMEIHISVK